LSLKKVTATFKPKKKKTKQNGLIQLYKLI
jgi:hypothetical protein